MTPATSPSDGRFRSTDIAIAALTVAILVARASGHVTETFRRMVADFGTRSGELRRRNALR